MPNTISYTTLERSKQTKQINQKKIMSLKDMEKSARLRLSCLVANKWGHHRQGRRDRLHNLLSQQSLLPSRNRLRRRGKKGSSRSNLNVSRKGVLRKHEKRRWWTVEFLSPNHLLQP